MFFHVIMTQCFFDRGPQIGEVIKKVLKPTPQGVGLKCFLNINPMGLYSKIACCKNGTFLQTVFFENYSI